jgi:hypothetical protein
VAPPHGGVSGAITPEEEDSMRRKSLATCTVLLVLVLAVFAGAGCGAGKSSSNNSPAATTAASTQSADQIVTQSEAKMKDVKSASFTADMSLAMKGDASKITDPSQKALLSQPISLHAEGKSSNSPMAADVKMNVGVSGQNLDVGFMAQGKKAWVSYQGKWYVADAKTAKNLDSQAQQGAAPTEQLKSLGLDPSTWGTTYSLVGTESLGGTQVYHVKATADPQKLADALLKAATDPKLAKKLGSQGQQLEQGLAQSKSQAESLKKGLKTVSVDYWIGVEDMLIRKAEFTVALDTTGQKGMQGLDGVTMTATVAMSDFNQPVTVTPPAKALPLNQLVNGLGGMTGGSI